ncbi:GLPGLI family protein [Amniculibacterium sp. G2-70]|uniref:GLPGLI family protein n=1 Tax=Amniculibacterium sp. G2-70 TaxID=2767188 RepID=UPI00165480D1|nr:GLPGLI family protein [Amniculibacterium sp. G2-70]
MYKFLIFLLFPIFLFSQEVKESKPMSFYYQFRYYSKINPSKFFQEYFVLNIEDGKSVFHSLNQRKNDSITDVALHESDLGHTRISFVGQTKTFITSYVFKKYKENRMEIIDNIGKDNFQYSEELLRNRWKISEEKKEIQGYACQKATVTSYGRTFVAWFAPQIPFHDGPYKFSGLPGLILELEDTEKRFAFALVKFDPKNSETFTYPKYKMSKLKSVEKKLFLEAQKNYAENILSRARSFGIEMDENKAREIRNRKRETIENE